MGIRRVMVGFLAILGGFLLFLIVVGVGIGLVFKAKSAHIMGNKTILQINFNDDIPEYSPAGGLTGFMVESAPTVQETVEAIRIASEDPAVLAIMARLGDAKMGLGKIQELRNAILDFRKKGKPAFAYADTFGEFGPGNGAYYLAAAFNQIYLQSSGDVGLTGISYNTPFISGTLEKLGVAPRMDHRGDYKAAMNMFTEKKFTAAHKESVQQIMDSQFNQITEGIARDRGLKQDDVRALIDRGPFNSGDALHAGLVDGLAYRDEVREIVKNKVGQGADFTPFPDYVELSVHGDAAKAGSGNTIALIYGVGAVHRGKSGYSPFDGETGMGSETLCAAFRAARRDPKVKAILFRIDSPGGSYVASDTIWRETVLAGREGKPVIVSMGDVAASGGYFVAMSADKIVAQPGALTGSIGVFAGKAVTSDFWDKLGVTFDEVHTSENAGIWSSTQDYTPEQWTRLEGWLDRVYDDFTTKVSQGRHLPRDKVLEIAQGRVWTGEDAKRLGLVDELGGFPEALRLARQAAGIPEGEKVCLKLFPKKKTLFENVQQMLSGKNDEDDDGASMSLGAFFASVRDGVKPLVGMARRAGLISREPEVLTMPEVGRVE